jgi:hypothetical protein
LRQVHIMRLDLLEGRRRRRRLVMRKTPHPAKRLRELRTIASWMVNRNGEWRWPPSSHPSSQVRSNHDASGEHPYAGHGRSCSGFPVNKSCGARTAMSSGGLLGRGRALSGRLASPIALARSAPTGSVGRECLPITARMILHCGPGFDCRSAHSAAELRTAVHERERWRCPPGQSVRTACP